MHWWWRLGKTTECFRPETGVATSIVGGHRVKVQQYKETGVLHFLTQDKIRALLPNAHSKYFFPLDLFSSCQFEGGMHRRK